MKPIVRLRAGVLATCAILVAGSFFWVMVTEPFTSLRIASLTQKFGLEATLFLYLTLLITPLSGVLPAAWRGLLVPARRPLGVASAVTALLHSVIGFWGELGGFSGLVFLSHPYLLSVVLSSVALLILLVMAATSFDSVIAWMGNRRWKLLHRFIYPSAYLVIIHVLVLGSDYSSGPLLRLSFVLFSVLLVLEALRIDRQLQKKRFRMIGFGVVSLVVAAFLGLELGSISTTGTSLSLHAGHDASSTTVSVGHVHYHANFLLYLNGIPYNFNPDKYMEPVSICSLDPNHPSPQARVHMHLNDGTLVHIHSVNVTWGDLFANLGFSINDNAIVTDTGTIYPVDPLHALQFLVNGQSISNISDRYINPNDRLLIDYGSISTDEVTMHMKSVPATAEAATEHTDPATCSGS